MRIGILTFHRAHNYGAVLQCYALQEFLKSQGHDVEVVDYSLEFKTYKPTYWLKRTNIFAIVSEFLTFRYYRLNVRYKKFNNFIVSYLNLSDKVSTTDDIERQKYDMIIIGSDQVWNPKITKGFNPFYWGYFKCNSIISYAASMEVSNIDKYADEISKGLQNFSEISVREKSLITLLEPLTDKTIYQTIDPTLLVDSAVFDTLAGERIVKDDYLLVYQVIENTNTMDVAHKLAKELSVKIIELKSKPVYLKNSNTIDTASPQQFLSLIKHAKCVVTTSFHGVAFSILFKKDFYAVKLDNKGTRIEDLIDCLSLQSRLITAGSVGNFKKLDYDGVNSSYNAMKQLSLDFLKNCKVI